MSTEPDTELVELVHGLTAFQRDVLNAITTAEHHRNHGVPYGLSVKEELEQRYGEELNHSRLYMNLSDLETLGLVEKVDLNDRTNGLRLTDGGESAVTILREWYQPD